VTRDIRSLTTPTGGFDHRNAISTGRRKPYRPRWVVLHQEWAELVDWGIHVFRALSSP
jgi:hypothetical protein